MKCFADRARLAFLLCVFGAVSQAADPSQFSESERRVFSDDHLRNLGGPAALHYAYRKRGSLEKDIDDRAVVTVGARDKEGGRTASVEFLSGARKLELPPLEHAEGNPLILFFLEREVREMSRLTGGAGSYFRKRIRIALVDGAEVRSVEVSVAGQAVAATEIRIAPYKNDPARARYEKFADKTYVFVFSDEVPGQVVELSSELFGPAADGGPAEMMLGESLIFVGRR